MNKFTKFEKHLLYYLTSIVVGLWLLILFTMPKWFSGSTSAAIVIYLTIGWKQAKIFWLTFPRDIKGLLALIKCKLFIYKCKKKNATVPIIFQETAKKYPDKVAFYYQDQAWTFKQLDEYSNQVANCFTELGFHPGEEVALFMNSKPEFVGIWLGLAKTGIVTAFINTNQRLDTLVHSITVVNCRAIIYESQLSSSISEIVPLLQKKSISMQFFSVGPSNSDITSTNNNTIPSKSLDSLLKECSTDNPININKGNFNDKLYYIYTSGTTGLPKAVVIRHFRYFWMGVSVRKTLGFRKNDIYYLSLPLYHNNAGTIGTAQALLFGNSLAIREKFSASQFWDDCIKYKCTGAMYIGEICRYLLAQPPRPVDHQHQIRIMFGNGLRAKIWHDFATRFSIKQIGEFYGSTEGNANVDNHEGSCGFLPVCIGRYTLLFFPLSLIKVDDETGEPIRDRNGLCIKAKPGETGEIVGKIVEDDPSRVFTGYASEEANKKKVVTNVFKRGDQAFLSGDLMVCDELGYLYFKDRTGDTYRWKGENVSTTEVEAVIQRLTKLSDCVVFGVEVPNCEGKAGMAVIASDPDYVNFEINNFASILQRSLPSFAVPIFLRLTTKIDLTGSFKLSKANVQKEGFDPSLISDPIYFLDKKSNQYIQLNEMLYKQILNGAISL